MCVFERSVVLSKSLEACWSINRSIISFYWLSFLRSIDAFRSSFISFQWKFNQQQNRNSSPWKLLETCQRRSSFLSDANFIFFNCDVFWQVGKEMMSNFLFCASNFTINSRKIIVKLVQRMSKNDTCINEISRRERRKGEQFILRDFFSFSHGRAPWTDVRSSFSRGYWYCWRLVVWMSD